MEVVFSEKAEKQLQAILEYFCIRNHSSTYSERLYDAILHKLRLIDHDMVIGVKTRRKNVYRLRVENYVIQYRLYPDYLEVAAVFDARRNVRADRFGL